MTLIAAIGLPNQEIAFVADSIATTTYPAAFTIGRTTQGEHLQPIVVRDQVRGFVEGACKIGAFGNTICAAAGNSALIYELLERLDNTLANWTDLEAADASLNRAQIEPVGESLLGTDATLIFAFRTGSGQMFCTVGISVMPDQSLRFQKSCKASTPGETWVGYFGSGADLLGQYYPSCIGAYESDRTLRDLLPSMLAMDLSAKVRTEQMNNAAGVGGTFVSVFLGEDTLLRSTDVVHIHANAQKEIQFFSKVIFRRGTFFVNDVIGRRGFAMRSLEEEVAYRLGNRPGTQDVTPEVIELLQYRARGVFLDVRSADAPNTPDVSIVENINGDAIPGMANLPLGSYPLPGSTLQFSCQGETVDLTVRA